MSSIEQLMFWRETLGYEGSWDERSERRWLLVMIIKAAWQFAEQESWT